MSIAEMSYDSDGCVTWTVFNLPVGAREGDILTAEAHSWYRDHPYREVFRVRKLFHSRMGGIVAHAAPVTP